MKHGITVRNKKSKELVHFVECNTGRSALRILGGVRMNLSPNFVASEEYVEEKELGQIKERGR